MTFDRMMLGMMLRSVSLFQCACLCADFYLASNLINNRYGAHIWNAYSLAEALSDNVGVDHLDLDPVTIQ